MTSTIKVNNIQNQCGANIINESSNTITIGASGDTVSLASGASQTGFGRTGTVDWQTGDIKTATFTAANGEGYFCNTTSGSFTVNLPAGSAGAIVSIQDYNNTFDSNSLTVDPNGSEKINGGTGGDPLTLTTEGLGITFVYIDSTVGWRSVQSNEFATPGETPAFVTATGGTVTTVCTNFKVHTFTGPGTFTVSCAGNPSGSNTVSYMVIAGGGGGGGEEGGGGGAGGYRESKAATDSYTASPLNATTGTFYNLPVSAQPYSITVGGGGAGQTTCATPAAKGSNSTFSTVIATGGGLGGGQCSSAHDGGPGGSGGGGHGSGGGTTHPGGSGNTPSTAPAQGTDGGDGAGRDGTSNEAGGGGGGSTVAGTNGSTSPNPGGTGGNGGNGATSSINGTPTTRGGGGGGGATTTAGVIGSGGTGGGGDGTKNNTTAGAGTANTGGGGGGGGGNAGAGGGARGGAGGSGVVIIRYRFQ